MATVLPRFAVSHTITGTCTCIWNNAAGAPQTLTVPAGTYWTDPLYTGLTAAAGSPDLLKEMAFLVDSVLPGAAVTVTYVAASDLTGVYKAQFVQPEAARPRGDNANNTASGRLVYRRIGVDPIRAFPDTAAATFNTMLIQGVWQPSRGENGSLDEHWDGYGSIVRAFDGKAYTIDIGDPQAFRLVELPALPVAECRRRAVFPTIDQLGVGSAYRDYSFETLLWPWLARGERLRYYQNSTSGITYLTTAMTNTSIQATFAANATGFAANVPICIDGEWVYLESLAAGTTWNLWRTSKIPVAHDNYSPASTAFVATYLLAGDGGNVSRSGFAPERRAPNDDRHDLAISLIRANA